MEGKTEKALLSLEVYPDGCKTDMNIESEADIQKMVYSLISMFDQAPHIYALFDLALTSAHEIVDLHAIDDDNQMLS